MQNMQKLLLSAAALLLGGCGAQETLSEGEGRLGVPYDETARAEVRTDTGLTVMISDGFVRPAAEGAASTAAYFTITADDLDTLTGASADGFAAVEIHTVTEEDGISRMRRIDGIDVMPGGLTTLRPGGEHLMMMGPDRALQVGDTVTVTLSFASGGEAEVTLPVLRPAAGAGAHEGMTH